MTHCVRTAPTSAVPEFLKELRTTLREHEATDYGTRGRLLAMDSAFWDPAPFLKPLAGIRRGSRLLLPVIPFGTAIACANGLRQDCGMVGPPQVQSARTPLAAIQPDRT